MVDDSSLVLQEIFYQPWSQANIFGLMAPDNHICLTSMSGDCALLRSNKTHLALETIELRFPSGPADIDSGKSHSVDSLKRLGLQLELCCSDSVMVGDYFLLACGYVIESHDDTKETQSEYFGLSIFTIDPSIKPSSADESTTSSKGMQFVSTEHVDVKSIPAMLKFLNLQVLNVSLISFLSIISIPWNFDKVFVNREITYKTELEMKCWICF